MKKFFVSLIILSVMCMTAEAHILYTTQNGSLGLIKVNGTGVNSIDLVGTQNSGGNGSVVASYWENNTSNGSGNSKIILITPKESSDTTVSGDTAARFSSYESLSKKLDDKDIYLAGTYGTPIICGTNSGGSLYLATGSYLREYKTADFKLYNSRDLSVDLSSENAKIKSVVKTDTRIYVLTAFNNTTVSNDIVMVLDGTLNPTSEYAGKMQVNTSKDAYAMDLLSDSRIAVGCSNGVYHVKNSSTTESLVSTDYPVVALHKDTGSGFYYMIQSEDKVNNVKINSLIHYTNSAVTPLSGDVINISGDKAVIVKDSNYDVLGVIIGEKIAIVRMSSGEILKTFTSADLGGSLPISITASSTTGNSADTSGGCMVSGAGVALMAALLLVLKRNGVLNS